MEGRAGGSEALTRWLVSLIASCNLNPEPDNTVCYGWTSITLVYSHSKELQVHSSYCFERARSDCIFH